LNIYTIDVGWQFPWLVDIERASVSAPGDGLLALIDSGNGMGIPTVDRVQVSALVGADRGNGIRIG